MNNEVNLKNPIFAYYIDTRGTSRQGIEEACEKIKKVFPTNVTLWLIPSEQPSKIECIYDGEIKINKVKQLYSRIDAIYSKLNDSNDFNEFKNNIRDILLNNIIEDEK